MPDTTLGLTSHWLLEALSPDERRQFGALKWGTFERNETLIAATEPPKALWLIDRGFISVRMRMLDGRSAEVGHVGACGVVPAQALLRSGPLGYDFVARTSGSGVKIHIATVQQAIEQYPKLRRLFDRVLRTAGLTLAQVSACNQLHTSEQKIVRCLLAMTWDRPRLEITQEELVAQLGLTSRKAVTGVYNHLTALGLIRCKYGEVEVIDRARLGAHACECAALIEKAQHGLADRQF